MKTTALFVLFILMTCNAQKNSRETTDGADGIDRTDEINGASGTDDVDGQESPNSDFGLTLIVNDPYSGTEVAETLIIKHAKNLQKFYSQINRTRKPGLPVPDIDFSKEMIVVRCSGKTHNDAMPNLYVMEETEDEIVLGIKKNAKTSSSSAVTTPFSVYRMPLTKKEVLVRD